MNIARARAQAELLLDHGDEGVEESAREILAALEDAEAVVATLQQERDGFASAALNESYAAEEAEAELVAVREDATRLREALSEMRTWAGALEATLGSAKRAKAKAIRELADAALVVSSPRGAP